MNEKIKRPSANVIRTALRQLIKSNGWEVLWHEGERKVYKAR